MTSPFQEIEHLDLSGRVENDKEDRQCPREGIGGGKTAFGDTLCCAAPDSPAVPSLKR